MRVVHVISPGPIAGAETVVLDGCEALHKAGVELQLLAISESRCPEYAEGFIAAARARGIPTEALPNRGRFDPNALLRFRRRLQRDGTAVIHAHGHKAVMYALAARPRTAALVATHHGETQHTARVRQYEALTRLLYKRVDIVFAVSNATSKYLVSSGVPRDAMRTVANPITLPPPARIVEPGPQEPTLLFVGRLSEEKGVDVLLRALALQTTPADIRLDVAGSGPCEESWKQLSHSLGLDDKVTWLGRRNDVPALLENAWGFVLPSRREGMPLVILEAEACEVPILASRVGGIPEIVWENENALLVPPGDVKAWADALLAFRRRADDLRQGARRRAPEIRERHAPAKWARDTLSFYDEAREVALRRR